MSPGLNRAEEMRLRFPRVSGDEPFEEYTRGTMR